MNALVPMSTARPLPRQDMERLLLHAQRYRRGTDAMRGWAEMGKKCVDYYENRQWSAADLAKLAREKRPALTINKIKRLVNLVLAYFLNNRTDLQYMPGYDGSGMDGIAQALTQVAKQISEANQLPFLDAEVTLDGLLTGRGYWDYRLSFEQNLLGDVRARATDPFTVIVDPDADQYDPKGWGFVMEKRWVSPEEVEFFYGTEVATRLGPFLRFGGVNSGMPTGLGGHMDDIAPRTRFGGYEDGADALYADYLYDWIDASRKNVLLLDIQHYVRVRRWFFVDLETGDSRAIPDGWDRMRVEKSLLWARDQGQPLVMQERLVKRARWTHIIGDVIAYDDWSPYDSFTLVPFFPYFRRGATQGMVEPLIDPQDEVNKRRSARLNILSRSAAGGWMWAKGALDAQQKRNLELFGSTPGVMVEWDSKEGKLPQPQPIQPSTSPAAYAQVENDAEEDLVQIAGINESALGQVDQSVMSGRAIERRQRQAVMGQELFMVNFRRSKELCGRKTLELVQGHYTEQRIIRVIGPGKTPIQTIINQRTAAGVVNDVSLGTYAISIDETPLSKSFLEAQFDELLRMKEMGMPVPDDHIIDASSVPRKAELKIALAAVRQAQQMAAAAAPMGPDGAPPPEGGSGPGGSRTGSDGGSLPAGQGEPGAPVAPPPAMPALQ
jgi:hypothetical protein